MNNKKKDENFLMLINKNCTIELKEFVRLSINNIEKGCAHMGVDPVRMDPHQSVNSMNVRNVQAESVKQLQLNVEKASEESQKQQEDLDLSKAMDSLKKTFERLSRFFKTEAQFTIERELNMIIIKIKDRDTGEIVRQIPPEVAVKIAKNLQELIGILFDEKV
ncbi:flagellar protein FlaG [Pseudothermotoga sp.]